MKMSTILNTVLFTILILGAGNTVAANFPLQAVTDKVHVIYGPFELPNEKNRGFRNNPVIVQTSAGVVVMDPGGSRAAGDLVLKQIRQLTAEPVVAVFNSHAHGDHWLGNEAIKDAFPKVAIYAHANARDKIRDQVGMNWLDTMNRLTKGTARGKRLVPPDHLVEAGDIITIGDTRFRIHHTGQAHTDGDIMVEIVEHRVIFTGDIVRNGLLGIMEDDSSFAGNVAAIDYLIEQKPDFYIPGHGRGGDIAMLKHYQHYLATLYQQVQKLYAKGLADYEMKPQIESRLAAFKDWAGFEMRLGAHISQAYLQVENEAF